MTSKEVANARDALRRRRWDDRYEHELDKLLYQYPRHERQRRGQCACGGWGTDPCLCKRRITSQEGVWGRRHLRREAILPYRPPLSWLACMSLVAIGTGVFIGTITAHLVGWA